MEHCVYLRGPAEHDREVNECQIHGRCSTNGAAPRVADCRTCKDKLLRSSPTFARDWRDGLVLYDRRRNENDALRGILAGRSAFLACGGPSAKQLPIEQLKRRGCFTLAINNSGGWYPCQAMVCSDPPSKFSHSIWLNPAIMKFVPRPKMGGRRGRLRRKLPESQWTTCANCQGSGRIEVAGESEKCGECGGTGRRMFEPLLLPDGSRATVNDMPNVWAFKRRSWLLCDDSFFLDDAASWGNQDAGVQRTGESKTACTMLIGLRLLRYLGASRIFLLGADFGMSAAAGERDNYAFPERRDADAVASNNSQYRIANDWLCRLEERGVFRRFGVDCYNCNRTSGLRAFPHVPFDDALACVCDGVEDAPDLRDWYAK